MKRIVAVVSILLLAGCVAKAADSGDPFDARDPIQPVNRVTFSFNLAADQMVIRPIATAYHHVPDLARVGISNFVTNLSEPVNMVNGVLQLNPTSAFTSFWRFMLNTTFGLGGLRDYAADTGLKYQDIDFGKTLGRYGVPEGAYVVLPLVGPSTVRDTTGKVVDWFMDPVGWVMTTPETIAQVCTDGIVTRDEQARVIDQFYYQSLEPYSATRAAYLQHQAFK